MQGKRSAYRVRAHRPPLNLRIALAYRRRCLLCDGGGGKPAGAEGGLAGV